MQIAKQKVVTIDYTLKDDNGTVLDNSENGAFNYLHGAGNVIPGLESALDGKTSGDELSISIEPQNAYGERNDELMTSVPRSRFENSDKIEKGMHFHSQSADGNVQIVTVVDIDADNITVDANHPLAGVNLNFDVKVIEVRDASTEEIEHGHVHGPDGHHHE